MSEEPAVHSHHGLRGRQLINAIILFVLGPVWSLFYFVIPSAFWEVHPKDAPAYWDNLPGLILRGVLVGTCSSSAYVAYSFFKGRVSEGSSKRQFSLASLFGATLVVGVYFALWRILDDEPRQVLLIVGAISLAMSGALYLLDRPNRNR
jgi:hypothetical protein